MIPADEPMLGAAKNVLQTSGVSLDSTDLCGLEQLLKS